jgi:hypothetical protein
MNTCVFFTINLTNRIGKLQMRHIMENFQTFHNLERFLALVGKLKVKLILGSKWKSQKGTRKAVIIAKSEIFKIQ